MPQTEYYGLVAVFLLRTISSFTTCYPPYCVPRQSFAAAFEHWQEGLDEAEASLITFALERWSDYCVQVKSPSDDLLAALDKFDPYSVLAMLIRYRVDLLDWAVRWKKSTKRAQSLGRKVPQTFVSTLRSFLSGFRIGFTSKPRARTTAELTGMLFGRDVLFTAPENFFSLVLRPATDTNILPEHWLVVHVAFGNTYFGFRPFATHIEDGNGKILAIAPTLYR
ncbi:hypothetical protein WG66_016752 [Moniliophthora roreri]|nr:hypothetical protein WG66_016752 [Moniliophthora roreri]